MDAGEGLYQGLAALAQGILRRRELQRQQDLIEQQKQQQGALLAALPQLFQKQVQVPATSEMARPQLGPVTGLTQPVTARGTGDLTATENTSPDMSDPKVLNWLMSATQSGINTTPVMGAIAAAQPKFQTVAPGTTYGSVKHGQFKPEGQAAFRPTQMVDWTISQGTDKMPGVRKTPTGGYEQLYEKDINGQKFYQYKPMANPPGGLGAGFYNVDDPKAIADSIIKGLQPPTTSGLYRGGLPVRGELARRGYDLSTANRDWTAINRYMSSLNGPQQVRLRQAIEFTHDSLDQIESLYGQLEQMGLPTGYKAWNKAALDIAMGLPGQVGATAQALQAQVNDMISELAVVYKGGNASTDESLRIASENLKTNWNPETFKSSLAALRNNLQIRRNSILNSTPTQVSPNTPYMPPGAGRQVAPPPGNKKTITLPDGTVITEE